MQETSVNSFANIHFPQRTDLIKNLRKASFIINDFTLISSLLVLVFWAVNVRGINEILFQKLVIHQFSSILFILSGIILFFGAKRHLSSDHNKTLKEEYPVWNTWIPISLAVITSLLGLANFVQIKSMVILPFFRITSFEGMCFFLLGLALIPPFTRIPHRFHVTQFIIFIVSSFNMFIILEFIYQLFSPSPMQQIIPMPIITALTFVIFCFGIILRWSNRGFMGNFTLDSTGSVFALRLFLINLLAVPLIAFIVLTIVRTSSYNMYQVLSVAVVCFTVFSCFILWINVKLLYSYELEHLLMREALRTHNIDLTTEKEALKKRMVQIEVEKQQYIDKLKIQNTWSDMADASG